MPQGRISALSAIENAVKGLMRLLEEGDNELALPALIGLQPHRPDRGDGAAAASSVWATLPSRNPHASGGARTRTDPHERG
ncbi:MAG: hypothetical protein IT514_01315 [Burkholderiales bacterium]|nr:hypothetical protein [Burkholderiales bacterium]